MEVSKNDVIQINTEHDWGGCLAIVSEVKSYGCQAYVEIPMQGAAFVNLKSSDYVRIGEADYVRET